jgi:hypothetical protein
LGMPIFMVVSPHKSDGKGPFSLSNAKGEYRFFNA